MAAERAIAQKTLVCGIQALEGRVTTVEFRDGTKVSGKIEHVDGFMNIDMSDVEYIAPSQNVTQFAKFGCQGKFIRCVIIPEDIDVIPAIKERLSLLRSMPAGGRGGFRGSRGRGFRGRGGRGYNPRRGYCKR